MIFLDNASTTQVLPECVETVNRFLSSEYYNPSAPYHEALELNRKIKESRQEILQLLKGDGEIIFTSSGSECDNLALFGSKKANNSRIIISKSEHPAVYNTAQELKQRGYDVVFAEVDNAGRVKEESFKSLMTNNTSIVSIMHVNNETGCINDIKTLCKIAKAVNPNVIFHSDGVQALGKIKISLKDLNVDMYSLSGHKIHAPKGIGALYVKKGIFLHPIIFGGGQENGVRSSTENVAGILSFTQALKIAVANQEANFDKVLKLNEIVKQGINSDISIISDSISSPYILCLALKYVRGEVMLHSLEKYGIIIGTGSACSSKKSTKKLPALLNLSQEYKEGVIRISFSRFNTESDIEYFINTLNLEYNTLVKYMRG